MKLLFDENLSPKLSVALKDVFECINHVRDFALNSKTDLAIWELAKVKDFIIVTKDDDFRHLSFLYGAPPKVVITALGNVTTLQVEQALRRNVTRIRVFHQDSESSILVISD